VHTFRVCCRLVRGFALDDDEALDVLTNWNALCRPPWTGRELRDKIWRARRYGREPIARLLKGSNTALHPSRHYDQNFNANDFNANDFRGPIGARPA